MTKGAVVAVAVTALALASGPARADVRALDLVRLLDRPGAPHPLGDASGRVPLLVRLPRGVGAADVGLMPLAEGLATIRLAPGEVDAFASAHPGLAIGAWPPSHVLLDNSAKLTRTSDYRARTGRGGEGVVVGVVDTGIDASLDDFRDESGHSRVAWHLDFSRGPLGLHPELEAKFGCDDPHQTPCAVLAAADVDAALAGASFGAPRDPNGHGTHVASIAAGDGGAAATARYVGQAPDATLVVARVTSGAGTEVSDADIVNAARFVFDRADAMGLPSVCNVSLGKDFGPHDGTSPLEAGLASFVGPARPGHALVVAAGNGATIFGDDAGDRLGIHTEVHVAPGGGARVPMISPNVAGRDASGQVFVWITMQPGDDLAVGLVGPDGPWVGPVARGSEAGHRSADGRLVASVFNGTVDGLSDLTADTTGAVVAFSGSWPSASTVAITLEGHGTAELWLEGAGDAAGSSTSLGQLFARATSQGTVSVPASHPSLFAVGATLNRVAWADADGKSHKLGLFGASRNPTVDSACYFSAMGPTPIGAPKPELVAPGAFVVGAMSHDAAPGASPLGSIFDAPAGMCDSSSACLVVDATHGLLSGSSMSAPQVAGAIALLLERDPALTQPALRALLQAGARSVLGSVPLDVQVGPGALDVEGAMAVYDAKGNPALGVPSPAKSWLALSSAYARPDARWSIVGTVELRDAQGAPVDGIDESRLDLGVVGGRVTRALGRVAPGLFQFEIAGAEGGAGGAIDLDVRVDGVTIGVAGSATSGRRVVPIGTDVWQAGGGVAAGGGAACATGAGPSGGRSPLYAALALSGALALRRRNASRGPRARRRALGAGRR